MAEKKKKLGRGLDSIFGGNVEQFLDEIQENATAVPGRKEIQIPVEDIRPNPYQPRKEFDEKALAELADSIRTHGIFTPLLVRKSVKGYDLVAGERRLRAAKMAELETVPAIVVEFGDDEMMEIALLENIQRENLNPIEEAAAFSSLIDKLGYTQEKLAERVGKSREYCANIMRLLKLPGVVQQYVVDHKLSTGHVRALLSLKDEDTIIHAAEKVMKDGMSVRETERYVKDMQNEGTKPQKPVKEKDPLVKDIENRMCAKLSTQVEITKKEIRISYGNTEDLNRILEMLGCIEESEGGI